MSIALGTAQRNWRQGANSASIVDQILAHDQRDPQSSVPSERDVLPVCGSSAIGASVDRPLSAWPMPARPHNRRCSHCNYGCHTALSPTSQPGRPVSLLHHARRRPYESPSFVPDDDVSLAFPSCRPHWQISPRGNRLMPFVPAATGRRARTRCKTLPKIISPHEIRPSGPKSHRSSRVSRPCLPAHHVPAACGSVQVHRAVHLALIQLGQYSILYRFAGVMFKRFSKSALLHQRRKLEDRQSPASSFIHGCRQGHRQAAWPPYQFGEHAGIQPTLSPRP